MHNRIKTNYYIYTTKIFHHGSYSRSYNKKNAQGKITHISVDVRKHKELISMFNEIGLMPKTKFQEQCEKGTPIEEAWVELIAHVRNFPWKKYSNTVE
jgi:hypothetical protein